MGSTLGVKDYEKFAWNKLDAAYPSRDIKLNLNERIVRIDFNNFYQQVMYTHESYLIMYYSSKERFTEGKLDHGT